MKQQRIRKEKPILKETMLSYLKEYGPSSATELSKAIDRNRANVSHALQDTAYFMKVNKQSKSVLYAPASVLIP